MKLSVASFIVLLCSATHTLADDFSGKEFNLGTTMVSVGSLLDCEAPDAALLKRMSPKSFAWAASQGLALQSAVTGTPSYSTKVTTKRSGGQPVLYVGCWVTSEIVTETINGKKVAYAKGSFRLSDTIRLSPFLELPVCKKKRPGAEIYVQGDYQLLYEGLANDCKPSEWQDRLPSLSKLESESTLFELRESTDIKGKKGYFRIVGF